MGRAFGAVGVPRFAMGLTCGKTYRDSKTLAELPINNRGQSFIGRIDIIGAINLTA